jgi:hypothetical protein
MFSLAYAGKGFVVNLRELPDEALYSFAQWFKEAADQEKAEFEKARAAR